MPPISIEQERISLSTNCVSLSIIVVSVITQNRKQQAVSGKLLFRKTLNSLPQPILSSHRHLLHAEGCFNLGVGHHIVLGQLLQPFRVQRQVQPAAHFLNLPFLVFTIASASLTHHGYSFGLLCGQKIAELSSTLFSCLQELFHCFHQSFPVIRLHLHRLPASCILSGLNIPVAVPNHHRLTQVNIEFFC